MKRLGWMVFAIACGQKSAPPLPVAAPPPLADVKAPPPDAAVVVDAGPDPAAIKAQAAADQAKALADKHDRCLAHAKSNEAELPKLPPPSKAKPTAAVILTDVGDMDHRYNSIDRTPAEGWWNGDSTRKKLAPKLSALTSCFAEALKRNPDLNGGITIGATLQESGALDSPRIVDDLVGDSTLAKCVVDKLATIKIPGGSKDASGFEAYFDIVFCPPQRAACLVSMEAPAAVKAEIKLAVEEQLDRMGACYRAAGKSHARGIIDEGHIIDLSGEPSGGQGEVLPFTGDDKQATAYQQAADCEGEPWNRMCFKPNPDVYQANTHVFYPDRRNAISVRTWFQR